MGLHGRHSWPRLESDEVCWVCLLIPICDNSARNKDDSTLSFSMCRPSGNCYRQRVVLWPTARAQHREIAKDSAKACDSQLQKTYLLCCLSVTNTRASVLGCSSSEWYVKCFQVLYYYYYYYATTTAIYSDIVYYYYAATTDIY